MSTEDDRPGSAGGYSTGGSFSTGGDDYTGAHRRSEPSSGGYGSTSQFDDAGFTSASTTVLPSTTGASADRQDDRPRHVWHGGADLGLLVLRLVLGGAFIAHGAQKVFGVLGGPGINGTAQGLDQFGFTQTKLLAWVLSLAEMGGGALVVLGLFTPLGAAAILGVMANVIWLSWRNGFFAPMGYEMPLAFAAAAFAILFAGPGRISLDVATPWGRKPAPWGVLGLLLAAGASLVTILIFQK